MAAESIMLFISIAASVLGAGIAIHGMNELYPAKRAKVGFTIFSISWVSIIVSAILHIQL